MAEIKEYPKMIYIEGKGTIVNTKEEEAKLISPAPVKKADKAWGDKN